ncbi:hypothetical protein JSR06_00555 [Candidatus Vidania fulgoroideae]|uniref:S1 motif domain-containing protein n=1 Tax=Candidatus Vidania fulgoroideorum TaxID=881286 RepID=A0A975ADT2_9PROT|nr:hypothetical protein JSR06_00555 [Candidatus Vidania fulgoroideae]
MSVTKIRSFITNYNSSKVSLRNFIIPSFFINSSEFIRYGYKIALGRKYYVFINKCNKVRLCNDEYVIKNKIRDIFKNKGTINGYISNRVKGGYEVKLVNISCFLPNSLSSNDTTIGSFRKFKIIRFSKHDNNIILSRRDYIEDKKVRIIEDLLKNKLKIITVYIKNISKFGIFVTYKNIDGLLKIRRSSLKVILIREGIKLRATLYKWNSSNNRVIYKFYSKFTKVEEKIKYKETLPCKEVFGGRKFSKISLGNHSYIISRNNMNWIVRKINTKTYIRNLSKIPSHNIYIYNPWFYFSVVYSISNVYGCYYKKYRNIYIYKLPFCVYGFHNKKIASSKFNIKYININKRIIILC